MEDRRWSLALWIINLTLLLMLAVLIVMLWQTLSGDGQEGTTADAILVRAPRVQVVI